MTAWWTDERIHTTVKQDYIERELGSRKFIQILHSILAFGDGLTDDTYLDWILERSPRIFLTLNQIGVPEKIFEFIDRAYADDDLPLSEEALFELNLFGGKSETLDKKFFREQFNFLIRELKPGEHTDYATWEVVPVELVARRPGITPNQWTDRVNIHNKLYTRKKVAIFGDKAVDEVHLAIFLKSLAVVQHSHIVSIWATYTQEDFSYVLLTPSIDLTLRTVLEEPPKAFKAIEKYRRREMMFSWIYCLTSALAFLHDKGFSHQALRPSAVTVDSNNKVHLNDYSAMKAFDVEDGLSPYSGELYEYAAPENWLRKPCLHETAALKTYLPGGGRTSRRLPKPIKVDPAYALQLPRTPTSLAPTKSKSASSGSSNDAKPRNAIITTFAPPQGSFSSSASSGDGRSLASDVFSMTTIILTLVTSILQHTPKQFASYRCRLNRQAGRGNAPPDNSFHKNIPQVFKWIDMMKKEAGQREKKDMKFWGAMVEIAELCRYGIRKDAKERIRAQEMCQKLGNWIDWGLGRRRTCDCSMDIRSADQSIEQKINLEEVEKALDQQDVSSSRYDASNQGLSPLSEHVFQPDGKTSPKTTLKDGAVWGERDRTHLHQGIIRSVSDALEKDNTVPGSGAHGSEIEETQRPESSWSEWRKREISMTSAARKSEETEVAEVDIDIGEIRQLMTEHEHESAVWGLADLHPGDVNESLFIPPKRNPARLSKIYQKSGTNIPPHTQNHIPHSKSGRTNSTDVEGDIHANRIRSRPPPLHPPPRSRTRPTIQFHKKRHTPISTSCIAVGVGGGSSEYSSDDTDEDIEPALEAREEDWPLPLGTLTLSHGTAGVG